jgi:hypothetical protein
VPEFVVRLPAEKPVSKLARAKSNQLQQSVMLAQKKSVCGNLFAEILCSTSFQPRRKNSVKWRNYNCRDSGARNSCQLSVFSSQLKTLAPNGICSPLT